MLFFKTPDFTYITRPIHTWVLFLLWPSRFILSGAISCTPLFPCGILDTFQPERLIFQCHIFLPFYTVHGVFKARVLEWFAILSSSGSHFVRTLHCDSSVLVALHSVAHSFIELCKPVRHDKAVIHEGVLLHIHTKTRGTQRNFWRLLICLTLIVVIVSQLYAYVKPHQIASIKCKFNV